MEAADSQETHQKYLKINFTHPLHAFLAYCLLLQLLEATLFVGGTETRGTREFLSYYNTRYLTSLISGTLVRLLHVNLKGVLAGLAVSMLRGAPLNLPSGNRQGKAPLSCHGIYCL